MDLKYSPSDSVVVTGASKGIGAAVVRGFLAEGLREIHVVGRDQRALDEFVDSVGSDRDAAIRAHSIDLADEQSRRRLDEITAEADILVNNAGAIPAGPLEEADLSRWRAAWDLKVWGYLDLTQVALRHMSDRGRGVILNMIGASGERHDSSYAAGSAGNAALMAFTRTVGAHSLDRGVRVVGVNPGPVETERLTTVLRARAAEKFGDPDRWRELTAGYPGGRVATVEEVADLAVWLASPRASYVSGTIVTIDGGMSWRGTIL